MAASTLSFNPDSLTIGDMEDFEEACGVSLDEAIASKPVIDKATGKPVLGERGRPEMAVQMSAKVLKTLVWIIKRQGDETFTLDDARKVRITEIQIGDAAPAAEDEKGKDSGSV